MDLAKVDRRRRPPHCSLPVPSAFVLVAILAGSVHAGSIFDDDYVPPQRAALPPNVKIEPLPAPSSPPVNGTAPESEPAKAKGGSAGTETSSANASARRYAVPSKGDQAQSRKLFKEAFAAQLVDKSATGREKLAVTLMEEAQKAENNPVDYFILLAGAIDAAEDAQDLKTCFRAAESMGKAFEVDFLEVKAEAAMKVFSKGPAATHWEVNAWKVIPLVQSLLNDEDFKTAIRVHSALQRASASFADPELKTSIRTLGREIDNIQEAREKLNGPLLILKTSPDDPKANSAVGTYLCFRMGQWKQGLPLLSMGSDAAIKKLAADELSSSNDAAKMAAVGDRWWTLAAKTPEPGRTHIMEHAAGLYGDALPRLDGLERAIVEKRIAEAVPQLPTLDIKAVIDGADTVTITRDAMKWTHSTWSWPSKVTVNGILWNPQAHPSLPITGPLSFLAHADLSTARLISRSGRDVVDIQTSDGVLTVKFYDGPNGSDQYEAKIGFSRE